jgi:hypothetical protein
MIPNEITRQRARAKIIPKTAQKIEFFVHVLCEMIIYQKEAARNIINLVSSARRKRGEQGRRPSERSEFQ